MPPCLGEDNTGAKIEQPVVGCYAELGTKSLFRYSLSLFVTRYWDSLVTLQLVWGEVQIIQVQTNFVQLQERNDVNTIITTTN